MSYILYVLFVVARELQVDPRDPAELDEPVKIAPGETVRLMPEYAAAPIAHLVWGNKEYTCDRSVFLASSSPIGRAT